jgi:hypothetical protein
MLATAALPSDDRVESDWEIRAFFRDPDGHLLEISQAK